MEVEDPLPIQEECSLISSQTSSFEDDNSCNKYTDQTKVIKKNENLSRNSSKMKCLKGKNNQFQKKCIELGLEENGSSVSSHSSSKSEKSICSDESDQESSNDKVQKSPSSSRSFTSSISSREDSENGSSSEPEEDYELDSNDLEENKVEKTEFRVSKVTKGTTERNVEERESMMDDCENNYETKELSGIANVCEKLNKLPLKVSDKVIKVQKDKTTSSIPFMKNYNLENNKDISISCLSPSNSRTKSMKRKRENFELNLLANEETCPKIYKSENNQVSITRLDDENLLRLDEERSKYLSDYSNPNIGINIINPDLTKASKMLISSNKSQSASHIKFSPSVSQNKNIAKQRARLKSKNVTQPENLLDQVAAAFAEQLTNFNLGQLNSFQTSQLNKVIEKQLNSEKVSFISLNKDENDRKIASASSNPPVDSTPVSSPSSETQHRLSVDTDDMIPIQAEVVMSEGSENGVDNIGSSDELKVNDDVEDYLQSFIDCSARGPLVEYPPLNNEVPKDGSDLTTWQLEKVSLPPFMPFVSPPSWLRLTIPAEGYKCYTCGDTFFIESSLVQHRERRSVWISMECGPCDAKLTFYNKCSFKDHIRMHASKGESVDEETVIVRPLPLQLAKLLQPIVVPVPKSLRPMKSHNKDSSPVKKASTNFGLESLGKENLPKEESPSTDVDPSLDLAPPPPTSKRSVRCYLCDRVFPGVRELMSHMRTNQSSSDQRVECRKCQLVLPSVCAAKAHILTHPPANSSNISVCPECGSRCDGPRDFVHHLNTCGHQYRRSGVLCGQCQVCFFKLGEDFINHWIKEHCSKSYECVVCQSTFESLVFHKCSSPGQQVLATFKCLLTCPLCPFAVQLHAQEERETQDKIRAHLLEAHPSSLNRVHFVYKSKFCPNAFRSKDELRAHHDREHRRDNHYRTKTCTLHHEVLGFQHQYFNGQEPRNAFVSLPVALSPEEIQEAQTRDVPTVSSVIDKTLFPDGPMTLEAIRGLKAERDKGPSKVQLESEGAPRDSPPKKDLELIESLRPCVCYRCGYTYTGFKDFRRHKRSCEGEGAPRLCQVCGVSAAGEAFARHCLSHVRDGLVVCMYCNCTPFATRQRLQQHFELHVHEQFAYPALCAFCPASMLDVGSALAHLQQEHAPPQGSPVPPPESLVEVGCERCGRKFHGERGLNVHLTRCTVGTATPMPMPAGGRQCHVCKKALTTEMFGKHIVTHLEEGLLVCSLCDGLTLPSSVALLQHLEEHASSLPLPSACPMCSFSMATPAQALLHLKEEHGFGDLSCSGCEMRYTFTYQLQRHVDIVHKVCLYAKRRYICWICRAYDHVKKETLMNHFRSVHGLSMQEVDEKVMIRTRGQGTMPTSQFIPTKPLGSKELGSSKGDKADGESPNKFRGFKISPDLHQGRAKTLEAAETKPSLDAASLPKDSFVKDEEMEINLDNIVIKKELLDVIGRISDGENQEVKSPPPNIPLRSASPPEGETKPSPSLGASSNHTSSAAAKVVSSSSNPLKTSIRINRRFVARNKDRKLRERTKVMIKRLPDSALSQRQKKRKLALQPKGRRREKAFKCDLCTYSTNSEVKLESHAKKHAAAKAVDEEADGFVCSECGESFVVEPSLKRHLFFAHKIKQMSPSAPKPSESCQSDLTVTRTAKSKRKKTLSSKAKVSQRRRITIKIKKDTTNIPPKKDTPSSPPKGEEKTPSNEKVSELQCCVCREHFETSVLLYSHLRTHGMAFLKLGRKKRGLVQERPSIKC